MLEQEPRCVSERQDLEIARVWIDCGPDRLRCKLSCQQFVAIVGAATSLDLDALSSAKRR